MHNKSNLSRKVKTSCNLKRMEYQQYFSLTQTSQQYFFTNQQRYEPANRIGCMVDGGNSCTKNCSKSSLNDDRVVIESSFNAFKKG